MVVKILNQKYKCGCGRGINYIDQPHVLEKLNSVLERDFCEGLPDDLDEFDPILKPGDVFLIEGGESVVAVDSHDRLILVVSNTGPFALDRLYEDQIEMEYKLKEVDDNAVINLDWSELGESGVEKYCDSDLPFPYVTLKMFWDRFVKGRDFKEPNIKVDIVTESTVFPVTFIISSIGVKYSSNDFEEDEEDMAQDLVKQAMVYLLNAYPRLEQPLFELSKEDLKALGVVSEDEEQQNP